jgi:hypothetical protein
MVFTVIARPFASAVIFGIKLFAELIILISIVVLASAVRDYKNTLNTLAATGSVAISSDVI